MALSEDVRSEFLSCSRNFVNRIKVQEKGAVKDEARLKAIVPLIQEHDQAVERLQAGLEEQLHRENERNDFAVLPSVWRTERMKLIHWDVQQLAKPDPKCLEQVDFAVLAKTYLDDLALLLGKAAKEATKAKGADKLVETTLRRMLHLIDWLGKKAEFLPTVTRQRLTIILDNVLKEFPAERLLRRGTFKLATITDGGELEISLGPKHITVRRVTTDTSNADDEWEVGRTADLDARVGDNEQTFYLTGVGLRKVLVANSVEMRDDWIAAINEVKIAALENRNKLD